MINILIVENTASHLRGIKNYISDKLNAIVNLHPANIEDKERNLNDSNYLIQKIQSKRFHEVTNFYYNIDLFIIDVNLAPNDDKLGIEFYEHLKEHFIQKELKVIIISNAFEKDVIMDSTIPFISKIEGGSDYFHIELIKKISEIFKLSSVPEQSNISLLQLFKDSVRDWGWSYAFSRVFIYFKANVEKLIDRIILIMFYLLMITTVFYGGWSIIEYIVSPYNSSLSGGIKPLNIAEHIFLNLLPIFIVFGYYNYYKTNVRISLVEGNRNTINEEASTKAMNLSKILFLSSIISYVLIRIIEEIFTEALSVEKLISFGSLLVILMTYFILLDRKHDK